MPDSPYTPDPERLSAALDRELPAEEQAAVTAQLEADADLRAEFLRLDAVKRLTYRAVNDEPLPDGLFARLQAALDAEMGEAEAAPPEPARRAPRPRRRAVTWLAVTAAAAAVALFAVRTGREPADTPRVAQIELNPSYLAMTHAMWHETFADAQPTESPAEMAAGLSEKLGYKVLPPDLAAFDARLKACTTCDHSVPGSNVAMFVMTGREGQALSLYELRAPAERIKLVGFEPTGTPGYEAATTDHLSLLTWAEGDLRVALVAADTPVEELLQAAPRALQVAQARTADWIASLP